jgi:hypothetical protein
MIDKYIVMRNLLDIINNTLSLNEGVGLANRKPGEKFKNNTGDIITFQNLEFYPEKGNFPDAAAMTAAVDDLARNKHSLD